jgi:pyruvate/2-oxoglutarate dehydrogenase complex dihydrolipoamide dehydrogenase (E3) component
MGGDCLNTGCVPSKALIRSAKLLSHMARAKEFGIAVGTAPSSISRGDGAGAARHPDGRAARFGRALHRPGRRGVEGTAKIVSPWEVEITRHDGATQRLSTRSIVIAAGARPFVPPIPASRRSAT